MKANMPNVTPQEGDYAALQRRVTGTVDAMRPTDGLEKETMTAPELASVMRAASQGVLRQLQEHGVAEAGTLAIRLDEAAQVEPLADLSYVVAGSYEGRRESGEDANAQAQRKRMALLAGAAGETATAVVGAVLDSDKLPLFVDRGRGAVAEYRTIAHNRAGATLLTGLLEQAEAAPGQAETAD